MGYAYDESPFVPLRTTTSGTTNPDKDAELARLRAALAAAKAECDAWRAQWRRDGYSATIAHDARILQLIFDHDARRAAEGKEPPHA